jgi:hypothetical protein
MDHLEGQAHVHASGINFGVSFGSLSAGIQNGTLNLDADATVTLQKSDDTKRLTLADLQNSSISDLVGFNPTGSLNATLPVSAGVSGLGTLQGIIINVHDADLFSGAAPDVSVSFSLSQSLQDKILTILQSFQGALQGLAGSILDTKLPVLGKSLDDVIGGSNGASIPNLFSLHDSVQSYFQQIMNSPGAILRGAGPGVRRPDSRPAGTARPPRR